jgi:cytidylate kinase
MARIEIPALPKMSFSPWETTDIDTVAAQVSEKVGTGRSLVIVDGQAGSGKSTFGKNLANHIDGSAYVAVDDISWWLHWIHWAPEALDGVIKPWLAGEDVDFRPPGWILKGRPGSVTATGTGPMILEGVCSIRHELLPFASFLVWVHADPKVSDERLIARDISLGVDGGTRESITRLHAEIQADCVPFWLEERPWDKADLVVDGIGSSIDGSQLLVHRP